MNIHRFNWMINS